MTHPIIESLEAFRQWFLSPAGPGLLSIPLLKPTHHQNGLTNLTLYRRNGYQAELCLIQTDTKFLLEVPTDQALIALFLGGSLKVSVTESSNPNDYGIPSPSDYLSGLAPNTIDLENPEIPHPLLQHPHDITALRLTAGTKLEFCSPQKDGILLFFSVAEASHPRSYADNVTPLS